MKKVAVITTHPIQYYAPVFKLMAKTCDLTVFYTLGRNTQEIVDPEFNQLISWDIPLLDGYKHIFLKNVASKPGSASFFGIKNPDIIQQLKYLNPHIIFVYGWAYQSHLEVIRKFGSKTKIWFKGDSILLNEDYLLKKIIKNLFLKWIYKKIKIAFYVGTNNKFYFESFGLKKEQLAFMPHAIDNLRFGIENLQEVKAIKKRININDNETLVLFAGKFSTKKNPLLLLEAFSKVKRTDLKLLFVGNGLLEESLKNTLNKLKIESIPNINKWNERVCFLPFQNQTSMPTIYQACDIYCLPSKSETWGLAVNEAFASKKPAIVSDKVGCAIDLINLETGFVFTSNHLEELAQILENLPNKKHLAEMGKKSFLKIQSWSFDSQIQAFKVALLNEGD